MMLEIRLYATLRRYAAVDKDGAVAVNFTEGMTVEDLFVLLDIPAAEVKLAMVNGKSAEFTEVLAITDRVGLFPPVGGG